MSLKTTALSGAYRAVWRWHFYAGLLVMPVLMLMALTGSVYLFRSEIEDAIYRPMSEVTPASVATSPDRWAATARVAGEGEVAAVLVPDRPDRAVRFTIRRPDDSHVYVFVDPTDAQTLGVAPAGGITETIKRIHSLEIVGRWGSILVEIVAGWAMILVATGLFLWWPRKREAGVLTVNACSGRPFWRDLHAITGLYAGAIIFFLAFTGMPWSGVWGDQILNVMRESGFGRPPAPAAASPWAHAEHAGDAPRGVGWTMENAVLPDGGLPTPRLSRVIGAADASQLAKPYLVSIPTKPGLAWTAARQVERVEDTRNLYVDAATGEIRADIRYRQFGGGAKAFEWGIAIHQGTQYGWLNRWLMLSGCVAVWLLGISGLVMWWRRRPCGRLGAPLVPPGPRVRAAVLGIVLPLSIIYPLTGLSLLAAILLDRSAVAIRRRLATSERTAS